REAKIADELLRDPSGFSRRDRGAEARREFEEPGRTADRVARFEDENLRAALGQKCRAGELVDAASEKDDVVGGAHDHTPSFSISIAARRPEAPMMPPPGWVPAPHW